MDTHTLTIPYQEGNAWTYEDLQSASFSLNAPFRLQLADNDMLFAEEVVRVLPKRRLVVYGTWKEKPVVAKLFFDYKHAKRHMEKEAAGVKTLRENKIPAPALYHKSISEDGRVYVLIFERIFNATGLGDAWHNRSSVKEVMPLLRATVVEIATHHVLGIMQNDLHLNNFLITKKTIYTIDGGQIDIFPPLLSKKQSMKNLALFLSQLGVGMEECQEKLFYHYAKLRGWLVKPGDMISLSFYIKQWNEKRWARLERKLFRSCSDFSHFRDWRTTGVYNRKYVFPEFVKFLIDPEMAFNHSSTKILKAGNSTTVAKVTLDHKEFVVKRYNVKNTWHWLRRCLRSTRASNAWRLAHKLNLFGVSTARPVAYIERRFLSLSGKSYYISEYVSPTHIGEYINHNLSQIDNIDSMVYRTTQLLKNLAKLDITHGDLKMTNILINQHEQPVLIDLDGAVENNKRYQLKSAWRKEVQRFLKNFENMPVIVEKFKTALMDK